MSVLVQVVSGAAGGIGLGLVLLVAGWRPTAKSTNVTNYVASDGIRLPGQHDSDAELLEDAQEERVRGPWDHQ